ncbi:unnamed protein product, partial [Arabidopsis halleri]
MYQIQLPDCCTRCIITTPEVPTKCSRQTYQNSLLPQMSHQGPDAPSSQQLHQFRCFNRCSVEPECFAKPDASSEAKYSAEPDALLSQMLIQKQDTLLNQMLLQNPDALSSRMLCRARSLIQEPDASSEAICSDKAKCLFRSQMLRRASCFKSQMMLQKLDA